MLFKLRGKLPTKVSLTIQLLGFILLISLWEVVARSNFVTAALLPAPSSVITSFKELHFDDALLRNLFYSIKLNLLGYIEAILIATPLGFIIGLFPLFRELARKYVDAMRFLPLTALTGLFIAWFGIGTEMKVHFLAFGIIVYLLPVVVQRISEVDEVYCDTVYTIGASSWQTIRHVFCPDVLSKLFDDIRIIVSLSWTYIIVAETINKSGGVGSLISISARQSRIDKVFALLIVIILVGLIQDKILTKLDSWILPHKHVRQ